MNIILVLLPGLSFKDFKRVYLLGELPEWVQIDANHLKRWIGCLHIKHFEVESNVPLSAPHFSHDKQVV